MQRSINDFLPDGSAPQEVVATPGMNSGGDYLLIGKADVKQLLKVRPAFSHKGTYGHALIIAGAPATMGAALLCAKACLYGGAGLTTAAIPESGLQALNTTVPEVMYTERAALLQKDALERYTSIAIGPGWKQGMVYSDSDIQLMRILIERKLPVLADADALNFFSESKSDLDKLPKHSVLTPHVKEFDRLFGVHEDWWSRLKTLQKQAMEREIVLVLKNQYTFIADQQGKIYINTTGGPAMAQGGMGDVLTGLIVSFIAQGYEPENAAIVACYLHGSAGDELAEERFNVTASAVAEQVPRSRFLLQSFAP